MTKIIRKNWFAITTITLSAAILTYTVFKMDAGGFLETLKGLKLKWIAAALLAVVVYWLLDGIILNKLTCANYKRYPMRRSITTGMVGLFYSAVTPFATGGQPMQIYEMCKTGVKSGDACSFIALKTILFQLCMIFYASAALITTSAYFLAQVSGFWLYVGFGLLCNGIFVAVVCIMCVNVGFIRLLSRVMIAVAHKLRLVKDKNKAAENVDSQINVFRTSLALRKEKLPLMFLCIALIFFQLTAYYVIPYCVFRSMGLDGGNVTVFYMICANAVITMVTAFVPLPGASGAAEGSFYIFFGFFFPTQLKLPAVVIWRFITYYCCILIGALVCVLKIVSANKNHAPARHDSHL